MIILEMEAVMSNGDSQLIAPAIASRFNMDLWKLVANKTSCRHLKQSKTRN